MIPEPSWTRVDHYFEAQLGLTTPTQGRHAAGLAEALAASDAAGLPPIQVSATQGKMLQLFARMVGARRILEIGTLGGYSAIWLASALSSKAGEARLVTLELEPRHAEVAQKSLARAGLGHVAEVRVGRAIDLLPALASEPPFDLVFIDADKPSNPDYFRHAVNLTRPGGVIVVDNVVRGGAVAPAAKGDAPAEAEPAAADANVLGVRALMDLVAREPRVSATAIQTVGTKGYDGFLLAVVVSPARDV